MFNFIKQNIKAIIMHKATNYVLLFFILAVVASYAYFANTAVRAVTVLQKTKTHMQALSVNVSEMEAQHLSLENNFNTQKALSMGLVEINNPTFIMKNANNKKNTTLSFKTD